jgi:hypothetical protein
VKDESLVPANPDILDGVDDLMQLSYLNEPSVLYNLQHRYNQNMIYVSLCISEFCSSILFANHKIFMHITVQFRQKQGLFWWQ